jgi:hypothetical protein
MKPTEEQLAQAEQCELAAKILREELAWEWELQPKLNKWQRSWPEDSPIRFVAIGYEIRLTPWTLGREVNGHKLGEGQEWHRQGFTREMLPWPTRPHIKGEQNAGADEVFYMGDDWQQESTEVTCPTTEHSACD